MLHLIGVGLGNEMDITLNALETIKNADFIYLENYTSLLGFDIKDLENIINKKVNLVNREFVENASEIIKNSKEKNVCLLIKGDVFSATTHSDLLLRVKEKGIQYKILHNASIITAVGDTGLSLYKFGKIISIPYDNKILESPYDGFLQNKDLHTLFLLDLNPSENKFMGFNDGINYLLAKSKERADGKINLDTNCVVCCGLGTENAVIKYGMVSKLLKLEIDVYPQCFIVPGKMHFLEEEALNLFSLRQQQ